MHRRFYQERSLGLRNWKLDRVLHTHMLEVQAEVKLELEVVTNIRLTECLLRAGFRKMGFCLSRMSCSKEVRQSSGVQLTHILEAETMGSGTTVCGQVLRGDTVWERFSLWTHWANQHQTKLQVLTLTKDDRTLDLAADKQEHLQS